MLAEHRVPLLQIDAVDDVVDEEDRVSRIVSLDRLDGGVALRAPSIAAVGALLGKAVGVSRAADASFSVTRSHSGKSAAPASPAAARRGPCPPGRTLAVRPRPETKSRVG